MQIPQAFSLGEPFKTVVDDAVTAQFARRNGATFPCTNLVQKKAGEPTGFLGRTLDVVENFWRLSSALSGVLDLERPLCHRFVIEWS